VCLSRQHRRHQHPSGRRLQAVRLRSPARLHSREVLRQEKKEALPLIAAAARAHFADDDPRGTTKTTETRRARRGTIRHRDETRREPVDLADHAAIGKSGAGLRLGSTHAQRRRGARAPGAAGGRDRIGLQGRDLADGRGRMRIVDAGRSAFGKACVTRGTVLTLLGFGLGAFLVAGQSSPRAAASPRESADALRARAIEAQRISAIASQRARELAAQWSDRIAREPKRDA
jgi:hypothetical protein